MTANELTTWLRNLDRDVRETNPQYSHNLVQGWPIPFFGDILHARVLTVGVNPSDKEFSPHRRWDEVTNPAQWQTRLFRYFQNSEVRPWIWFETWAMCLTLLDLGYAGGGAAHIDVSPRPTKPMLDPATDAAEFRNMVEHDVKWFFDLLNRLSQVQLLLVAGPIPRADGGKQQLADFIREQAGTYGAEWNGDDPLPRLVTPDHPAGIPVFICSFEPGVDGLYAMIRQVHRNRDLLLRLSAPGINAVPIMPARLDWPSAIGSFLLSFGMLEYFVFVFLKDHIAEDQFDKVKEWHLKDRLDEIAEYLKNENYSPVEQASFEALVGRVAPMRELRNHIAHGQMNVRFAPDTMKPSVTLLKAKDVDNAGMPATRHLEFAELEAALETIAQLNQEFERLAGFKPDESGSVAEDLKNRNSI